MFGIFKKAADAPVPTYCPKCKGLNANPAVSIILLKAGEVLGVFPPELKKRKNDNQWGHRCYVPKPLEIDSIVVAFRDGSIQRSKICSPPITTSDGGFLPAEDEYQNKVCKACAGEGTAAAAMRRKMQGLY